MLECLCSSKAQVDRVHRMSSSWTDVGTWDSLSPAQSCSHFPKWQFLGKCMYFVSKKWSYCHVVVFVSCPDQERM